MLLLSAFGWAATPAPTNATTASTTNAEPICLVNALMRMTSSRRMDCLFGIR
jgi:hypothetical protein